MSENIDTEPGTAGIQGAAQNAGVSQTAATDVINSLNSFVNTQFQGGALRTQMQTQPCAAAGFIREIMAMVLVPKMEWRHGWTDKAENFLADWVRESLQRQGRAGGGLVGGKSLARFMIDAGPRTTFGSSLLPPGPRAALLGWLPEAQWLERGHLPSGQELASGAWVQATSAPAIVRNEGEKLANGVYLYPAVSPFDPERSGSKLRGPKVSALIHDWIRYQAANVSGTDWNGIPGPRATLTKMVGTWRGTGPFGLWQNSDGAQPGSRVYAIDLLMEDAEELLASASDLCDQQWALEQQLAASQGASQAAQTAADILEQEAESKRRTALVYGGLAIGAALALGMK